MDPLAGYGVDALDALDFVVEKGDAETLVAEFAESRDKSPDPLKK